MQKKKCTWAQSVERSTGEREVGVGLKITEKWGYYLCPANKRNNLHNKRFRKSYCAKVVTPFLTLSFQWWTRAETLAIEAIENGTRAFWEGGRWWLTRLLYPELVTSITTCMVLNPLTIEFVMELALVCWTVYLIIPYFVPSSPWFRLMNVEIRERVVIISREKGETWIYAQIR